MAKQRYINTFFWDDPYIEDLDPAGKLLFIYLITTPLTNIAGSFEITIKKMADHTGLGRDTIGDLLKQFEADGKFIYRRPWMLAINAIDHQNTNNPQIRTGIAAIIDASPEWVKNAVKNDSYRLKDESSHLNLNLNLNSISKNGETPVAAVAAVQHQNGDPWTPGIELLKTAQMTEAQARPFLGRLAKQYSAAEMHTAIEATASEKPADPRAFLIAVLRERSGENARVKASVGKYRPEKMQQPVFNCRECCDTGEILVPVPEDRRTWSQEMEKVACPECGGDQEL